MGAERQGAHVLDEPCFSLRASDAAIAHKCTTPMCSARLMQIAKQTWLCVVLGTAQKTPSTSQAQACQDVRITDRTLLHCVKNAHPWGRWLPQSGKARNHL